MTYVLMVLSIISGDALGYPGFAHDFGDKASCEAAGQAYLRMYQEKFGLDLSNFNSKHFSPEFICVPKGGDK